MNFFEALRAMSEPRPEPVILNADGSLNPDVFREMLRNAFKNWRKNHLTIADFFAWIDDHPDLPIALCKKRWNCLFVIITCELGGHPISSPLLYAEECVFKIECMKYLIGKGANPKHQSDTGATLLVGAVSRRYAAIVEYLLNVGVDPSIQYKDKTALDYCKENDDSCRRLLQNHRPSM